MPVKIERIWYILYCDTVEEFSCLSLSGSVKKGIFIIVPDCGARVSREINVIHGDLDDF
jgi:hypothetical protein